MNRGLLDRLERTLRRLTLRDTGLVVAVSGGPDSVALLLALLRLPVGQASRLSSFVGQAARLSSSAAGTSEPLVLRQPLVIAHLNHQLRGEESDADEAFVRSLHATLVEQGHAYLRLACARLDIATIAKEAGVNLEGTARAERYRWLVETARQHDLQHVVTGHTADDQAETVLHRLLRGTGLQGLRGIAERRPLADRVELVRPMLDVTRAEVLEFLQAEGITAREDSTNADLRLTRNRIRHELLPYLAEHFNPCVREVLGRLARDSAEAFEEERAAIIALLAEVELPRAGSLLILDREKLAQCSRRRVRQLFRFLWERENWSANGMTFEHWQRLQTIVFDDMTASDLPGGLHVRRRDRVVQLGKR